MRKEYVLALIAAIAALIFLASGLQEPGDPEGIVQNKTFLNYSNLLFNYEITRYPTGVEIAPAEQVNESIQLGFVTDSWNINFGSMPGNGSFATRNIEFSNSNNESARITLKSYGNISGMVAFSDNDFVLRSGDKKSVDVYLFSNDTDSGVYSGEIDVIAKKAIYNFFPIE